MLSKATFQHNSKLDPDGFVFGQGTYPTSAMRYGAFSMSYNGCEVIAVYNALRLIGRQQPLSETVCDFSRGLHPWLFGVFGTAPSRIGRYLKKRGIEAAKYRSIEELSASSKDGSVLTVTYWTSPKLVCTVHTVAVRRINGECFEVYNLFNNCDSVRIKNSLKEIVGDGRFICGYLTEHIQSCCT